MVVRFRQSMMDPSPFSLHLPRSCRRMTYGRCVLSASSVVRALASAASWRRAQQTGGQRAHIASIVCCSTPSSSFSTHPSCRIL